MGIISDVVTMLLWIFIVLFNIKCFNDIKHLKRIMILELIIIIGQTIVIISYKLGL